MKRILLIAGAVLVAALSAFSTGCTIASATRLGPQSHFVYPNSNVKTLGPVRVKMRGPIRFYIADNLRSGETDRKMYDLALRQVQGANVITDYVVTAKTFHVPIELLNIPFWFYWNVYELEGTAARMEVGRQVLR